mgnify:CR=1 FL=1
MSFLATRRSLTLSRFDDVACAVAFAGDPSALSVGLEVRLWFLNSVCSWQSNPWAGYAWDAQHLQVGALLIAWTFYAFFCEMQGNLSAGRYKRVMTWMLNFPTFVFMIGNMILSSRRTSDGVQTDGSANADYIIGACLLVLVIANTVVFAAHKAYKAEDWFNVVEGELVDDRREDPIDPESILNNRFWLQSLLHLVTIACLLYFCIVGLANYDNNKGWLLTSEYVPHWVALLGPTTRACTAGSYHTLLCCVALRCGCAGTRATLWL